MIKNYNILCDVDCTLYSYREIIKANQSDLKNLARVTFGYPDLDGKHTSVARVWNAYHSEIEKRITSLISNPRLKTTFYSAFPAEEYKINTFAKLNARFISSYPVSKNKAYSQYFLNEKFDLTVGDRISDVLLSKVTQSKLAFIPIFSSGQWRTGPAYTQFLLKKILSAISIYEN